LEWLTAITLINHSLDGLMNGWMNGWMDGWMNGCPAYVHVWLKLNAGPLWVCAGGVLGDRIEEGIYGSFQAVAYPVPDTKRMESR
jgi:hypothetical protein